MIVPELWNAEEPLKKAGFKMYPGLLAAPAFGKVEYGQGRAQLPSLLTLLKLPHKFPDCSTYLKSSHLTYSKLLKLS